MMTASPVDGAMLWETESWRKVQDILGTRDHGLRLALIPAKTWSIEKGGGVYALDRNAIVTRISPMQSGPAPTWRFDRVRGIVRPWMAMADPAVSSDGKSAAICVCEEDGSERIDVYDIREAGVWERAYAIDLEQNSPLVYQLAFTPDGTAIATSCADRIVRLWESATGRALPPLQGHNGAINGLAFSPDGNSLATAGSADETVKIWSPRAQIEDL